MDGLGLRRRPARTAKSFFEQHLSKPLLQEMERNIKRQDATLTAAGFNRYLTYIRHFLEGSTPPTTAVNPVHWQLGDGACPLDPLRLDGRRKAKEGDEDEEEDEAAKKRYPGIWDYRLRLVSTWNADSGGSKQRSKPSSAAAASGRKEGKDEDEAPASAGPPPLPSTAFNTAEALRRWVVAHKEPLLRKWIECGKKEKPAIRAFMRFLSLGLELHVQVDAPTLSVTLTGLDSSPLSSETDAVIKKEEGVSEEEESEEEQEQEQDEDDDASSIDSSTRVAARYGITWRWVPTPPGHDRSRARSDDDDDESEQSPAAARRRTGRQRMTELMAEEEEHGEEKAQEKEETAPAPAPMEVVQEAAPPSPPRRSPRKRKQPAFFDAGAPMAAVSVATAAAVSGEDGGEEEEEGNERKRTALAREETPLPAAEEQEQQPEERSPPSSPLPADDQEQEAPEASATAPAPVAEAKGAATNTTTTVAPADDTADAATVSPAAAAAAAAAAPTAGEAGDIKDDGGAASCAPAAPAPAPAPAPTAAGEVAAAPAAAATATGELVLNGGAGGSVSSMTGAPVEGWDTVVGEALQEELLAACCRSGEERRLLRRFFHALWPYHRKQLQAMDADRREQWASKLPTESALVLGSYLKWHILSVRALLKKAQAGKDGAAVKQLVGRVAAWLKARGDEERASLLARAATATAAAIATAAPPAAAIAAAASSGGGAAAASAAAASALRMDQHKAAWAQMVTPRLQTEMATYFRQRSGNSSSSGGGGGATPSCKAAYGMVGRFFSTLRLREHPAAVAGATPPFPIATVGEFRARLLDLSPHSLGWPFVQCVARCLGKKAGARNADEAAFLQGTRLLVGFLGLKLKETKEWANGRWSFKISLVVNNNDAAGQQTQQQQAPPPRPPSPPVPPYSEAEYLSYLDPLPEEEAALNAIRAWGAELAATGRTLSVAEAAKCLFEAKTTRAQLARGLDQLRMVLFREP